MRRQRVERWLPLGEAASRLGVDEATLRHWADTGRIRTFRTPGGHRRFQEGDLDALIHREVPRVEDLGHLLERRCAKLLARKPAQVLAARPWFSGLGEPLRARAREHGRQVFDGVIRFAMDPGARKAIRQQLEEAGRDYGRQLRRAGLGTVEAAEAFGYFRHLVLEMVTKPRGRGGMLDEEQAQTLIEVSDLLDVVFLSVLRAWQEVPPGDQDDRMRILQ
ncbi:MAG: helix-turn-helix domain-containing protein [Armatimonadetes bacterium]|nr:helix-turn-helix domain-containing protein [Armatimonadota bacterium]